MTKLRVAEKNFYIYLQKHYAGKIVAYSESKEKVLAAGDSYSEIEQKLKKKKVDFGDVVYAGPIPHYKQTYVYRVPL